MAGKSIFRIGLAIRRFRVGARLDNTTLQATLLDSAILK